ASLWPLLAQVNNLSTDTDDDGAPLTVLKRGQSLFLPDRSQISQFRMALRETARVSAPKQGLRAAILKHGLEIPAADRTQHLSDQTADEIGRLEQIREKTIMDKTVMVNNLIEKLGASCRIVSRTLPQGESKSFLSQLEVLANDRWLPIVTYEVHDEVSIRR